MSVTDLDHPMKHLALPSYNRPRLNKKDNEQPTKKIDEITNKRAKHDNLG